MTAKLAAALRASDGLIADAQRTITKYLMPDGYSQEELIDRLIELFDGPRQRRVQSLTQEALEGTPQ